MPTRGLSAPTVLLTGFDAVGGATLNPCWLADNHGAPPIDTPVMPDGPVAYFSSLPIKAMLLAVS